MHRKTQAAALFIFLISILFAFSAQAGWVPNGNPLCMATKYQGDARIIPDGVGGAIITWYDGRGFNNDIYAQRIDAWGNVLWADDGEGVCTYSASQSYPEIISDGSGGAFICWMDPRDVSTGWDIYVQWINPSGSPMWTAPGVPVCQADYTQGHPWVVSDGAGGVILVWYDQRDGGRDLYAGRVNAAGTSLWGNGIPICTAPTDQVAYRIVSDGAGGAIFTWSDERIKAGGDVFAQRIDASGDALWTLDGIRVCNVNVFQQQPQIVSDGSGGAIIAWEDERGIIAQRIDADGTGLWFADGDTVCVSVGSQVNQQIAGDGSGGAVITWEDFRNGGTTGYDIYAQRIDSGGNRLWGAAGQAVCTSSGHQLSPYITSDGSGAAVVTWVYKIDVASSDIYARVIDSGGTPKGGASGVALCTASGIQHIARIAADSAGGALVCWGDARVIGDTDIYASRILFNGATGIETPELSRGGHLGQNYPNPFNPSTTMRFNLPQAQFVNLSVYSVDGRLVATLINESRPAGPQNVEWDGHDELGHEVSSGVYFYRLESGSISETKRMVLVK